MPFAAVIAAVPVAWGGWLGWTDIAIAVPLYFATCAGVTVGFHRCFTHRSFKPNRPVKVALAVLGSLAIEGPVVRWVADHRKHHKFSDKDGDPHSPWKYGDTVGALWKGLWHAHLGWLFDEEQTPQHKYAPDLMRDRDIVRVSRLFWLWVLVSLLLPPGARRPADLVLAGRGDRVLLGHAGARQPAAPRHLVDQLDLPHDRRAPVPLPRHESGNVWWLAIPSMGESWHNLHHADPTCARHGVGRGQLDASARMIWLLEKAGWVRDVRWPDPDRIDGKRVEPAA